MTKILVAEDERDIQFLIAFALQAAGYEVLTANNGEEAVAKVNSDMPALVLTDVRMPKMTGYEACRQIKSNPATAHIPVVFLSAKGQEAEVQSGMDAGGDAYLLKPFEVSQLTKKVAEILEKTKPAAAA
jgi:two-component system alkaline phosphatase synthesis response regulator PhoP